MTRATLRARFVSFGIIGALVAACGGEEGANFNVSYAPNFNRAGAKISVFGVFRDGRMQPETWDDLAPKFSGVLHDPACAAAISTSLRASSSPVYTAVDDVARADGITDELLAKFEPAANGDAILVIVIDGKTSKPKDEPIGNTSTTQGGMGMGGMGRGRGMPRQSTAPRKEAEKNLFEMSATLYSKQTHQSVALVAMSYSGESEDDAVRKFAAKVASAFPGATCAGWAPDLKVDADAIRSAR